MVKTRTPTPKKNALSSMEAILEEDPLLEQVEETVKPTGAGDDDHHDTIPTRDVGSKTPISILARKLAESSPHPHAHHHVHFYLPDGDHKKSKSQDRDQRELYPEVTVKDVTPERPLKYDHSRCEPNRCVHSRCDHLGCDHDAQTSVDSGHYEHYWHSSSGHKPDADLAFFESNETTMSSLARASRERFLQLESAWKADHRAHKKPSRSIGNLTKYDHHDPPRHFTQSDHLTTHKTRSGQLYLTHSSSSSSSRSLPSRKGPHKFLQVDQPVTLPKPKKPSLYRSLSDTWFTSPPKDDEYKDYSIAHRSEESLPELKYLQGCQSLNWRLEPKMRALSTPKKDLQKLVSHQSTQSLSEVTPLIKTFDADAIVHGLVQTNFESNLRKDQKRMSHLLAAVLAFAFSILAIVLLCKYVFVSSNVQEDPWTYDNWFILSGCFIGVIIFCYIMTLSQNRSDFRDMRSGEQI